MWKLNPDGKSIRYEPVKMDYEAAKKFDEQIKEANNDIPDFSWLDEAE
ncbi:MAG: hypothetical protein LBT85_03445 [Bifidobacteriaceae bacterium]|jgi:hypothetical protein|nr:hypothetical protein [Bifidobacteriaceae bacterium]